MDHAIKYQIDGKEFLLVQGPFDEVSKQFAEREVRHGSASELGKLRARVGLKVSELPAYIREGVLLVPANYFGNAQPRAILQRDSALITHPELLEAAVERFPGGSKVLRGASRTSVRDRIMPLEQNKAYNTLEDATKEAIEQTQMGHPDFLEIYELEEESIPLVSMQDDMRAQWLFGNNSKAYQSFLRGEGVDGTRIRPYVRETTSLPVRFSKRDAKDEPVFFQLRVLPGCGLDQSAIIAGDGIGDSNVYTLGVRNLKE